MPRLVVCWTPAKKKNPSSPRLPHASVSAVGCLTISHRGSGKTLRERVFTLECEEQYERSPPCPLPPTPGTLPLELLYTIYVSARRTEFPPFPPDPHGPLRPIHHPYPIQRSLRTAHAPLVDPFPSFAPWNPHYPLSTSLKKLY